MAAAAAGHNRQNGRSTGFDEQAGQAHAFFGNGNGVDSLSRPQWRRLSRPLRSRLLESTRLVFSPAKCSAPYRVIRIVDAVGLLNFGGEFLFGKFRRLSVFGHRSGRRHLFCFDRTSKMVRIGFFFCCCTGKNALPKRIFALLQVVMS